MSPTTTTTATDLWPPAGWITKKEAAKRLDRSEERIAGMVREEVLRSGKLAHPEHKQLVTLIHEGDVERILWERKHPPQGVVDKPNTPEKSGSPLGYVAPPEPDQPVSTRIAPRPWLTLDEAAEFSGLTKRWLLELAETFPPAEGCGIAIRDMGKHSPGGRWRFHRESLEKA